MNLGLSKELKAAFSDILPVQRPLVNNQEIMDPNWLAGFVSGEGCFYIKIRKLSNYRRGVELVFKLSQHSRDEQLMKSLIKYLNCGNMYSAREEVDFIVTKFSDLTDKIILLFQKYPIQGVKHLDFLDFVKVAEIMKEKGHLTERGLDQIIKIKAGMNQGRKY